jgi:hypothetical protein
MPPLDPLCLHCERRPGVAGLGLCPACHASDYIRILYVRRRGWTPAWEAHLRRLADRAKRGLPLFDPSYDRPVPPLDE